MQSGARATIEPGSFVELRGRPWLVEEVQGEADDLQTLNLSCISDDAQGERLEILWMPKSAPSCSMRMGGGMSAPAFLIKLKCWPPTFAR